MTTLDLKPCPCCNGKPELWSHSIAEPLRSEGNHTIIVCSVCELQTPKLPRAVAIERWNKRTADRGRD